MKKRARIIINIVVNAVFYLCVVAVGFLCLQVFFFASFKIPSDSMYPALEAGDRVLVCKPIYGARLFNLFATLREERVDIYRVPGIRKIRRNEVVVFNFPHPKDWNKIEMHIMKYYVKRCLGLPGDTFLIRNGMYEIKGINQPFGNREGQEKMAVRPKESFEEGVYRAFPFDSVLGWNIKEFGPLYIPGKGDVIALNRRNYLLYKKLIEWERNGALEYRDSLVYLDRQAMHTYTFQANYYFVAGDRVEDSQDSRYWGLLPEAYIVGKAWIIWKSTTPYSGKFRWERFMKKIT